LLWYFDEKGEEKIGYQTLINAALREYVRRYAG